MNKISVIIPALNEEKSISKVISSIPKYVNEIIVVDNGSADKTSEIAKSKGALVLFESKKGYGYACIKAIEFLKSNPPNIIVFLDGDYSDYPEEMDLLINPIIKNKYEFVMGARIKKLREPGSMTDHGKIPKGQWDNLPETFTATNGAQYLIENIHSLRSSR